MLFNSYAFILVFLPITFFTYFYLNSKNLTKASRVLLVCSSLFFYSWWDIIYLPLILSSLIFNFIMGNILTKVHLMQHVPKKVILFIAISANIILLAYFKYVDFFIVNLNALLSTDVGLLNLALPLAISFFTFQQIAYLVDSYREETKEYSFLNYAVFVTFFPQLIAGPIVHHKEMIPQFANHSTKSINYKNIALGSFIFSMGLFKKVVIADTFAIWATQGFDTATVLNFYEAWATSLSYTFQLYFDFSGYADMAIGLALLFNIKLPVNFNSPYKAINIQDFWRRWHITLSRFLRDYVYIPLGGSRNGNINTSLNIMATFIIGGIWHGAGWTFVFWGFLHGAALVIYRFWSLLGFKMWAWLAWFITFNFVNISWVFFRAQEWDDAIKILGAMSNINDSNFLHLDMNSFQNLNTNNNILIGLLFGFWLILYCSNTIEKLESFKPTQSNSIFMVLLFISSFSLLGHESEFLYFNF